MKEDLKEAIREPMFWVAIAAVAVGGFIIVLKGF